MLIQFFSRNQLCGFSVNKVYLTIIEQISLVHSTISYEVPSNRASFISILRNLWFVYKNRNRKAVNHITGDIHYCVCALIGCKSILTIHDLGFIHDKSNGKGSNSLYRIYRSVFWIYLPCFFANKIICISNETAEAVKNHLNKSQRKKIVVISNPVDSRFTFSERAIINSKPVILHIGTKSNKNLERVILALRNVYCSLHIVGNLTECQEKLLKDCHIEFWNGVALSDDEIFDKYKDCDIVSFPSLYEGFGMPIIEAQATGRALVTSNIGPMKTIAGKGAILVDPYSVDSIRDAFLCLINNPKIVRQSVEFGRMNVKIFDKRYISEQYMRIYDSLG